MPPFNDLRDQAGSAPVFRWLSAAGASALSLLFLYDEPPPGLFGGSLGSLGESPRRLWLRTRDGEVLDEAMGCRGRDGILLTLHGGPGVRRAVEAELEGAGWTPARTDGSPFAVSRFQRATLGLLDKVSGEAAVTLMLEAAAQQSALESALRGDPTALLEDSANARFLITSPRVQLWGPVNAGKSSLLNALCGRTLATVGEEPGLTRDVIEGRLRHQGFELRLFDAPGIWAGSKLDDEALELARHWQAQAELTVELVPPGGTPPPSGWWYHSRVDESGLNGISVRQPETLTALKDRLVKHFFGALRALPPERRFALHPEVRADLQALAQGNADPEALRAKWLG